MIPMFVYGTLLRGEPLEPAFFDLSVRRTPARLPRHRLYFAPYTMQYPVAISDEGGDDYVLGELVYADMADIEAALRMEARAGYEARRIVVEVDGRAQRLAMDAPVQAIAAIWPGWRVGARIPSGDWRNRA